MAQQKSGKKSKKAQRPVSCPLSPTRLTELKVLEASPPTQTGFDPGGGFSSAYDLWITYGHVPHSGNRMAGHVKLAKSPPEGGTFTLDVTQTYGNAEGVAHTLSAKVTCNHDRFALPRKWKLKSTFGATKETWEGIERELTRHCEVAGQVLRTRTNGKTATRRLEGVTTGDWCLFEAVQRMPFDRGFRAEFDVLEGLSSLRPGHRITYEGKTEHHWGAEDVQLHYFRQFGQGMLPYEYFLDDSHRLVLVVSGYRAYILKGGKNG